MTHHIWGDDWEHWKLLNRVIVELYERLEGRGLTPHLKEKWGTIRYEFLHAWLGSQEDVGNLFEVLLDLADEYPEVEAELLDDIVWSIDEEGLNPRNLHLYIDIVSRMNLKLPNEGDDPI